MEKESGFTSKLRIFMSLLYIPIGAFILYSDDFAGFLQGGFRIAFGILVIGYGIARLYYAFFKQSSNQDQTNNLILITFLILSSSSCGRTTQNETGTDLAPTIYVDETLEPVIKEEVFVFDSMEGSSLNVKYVPENIAIDMLLKDSTALVIVSNPLDSGEINYMNKKSYYPKVSKLAVDAVAVIANLDCKDSVLSISTVKDILIGKIVKWSQINGNVNSQPVKLVFDNKESSIVKFMRDSVCQGGDLGGNIFALDKNEEVIKFVSENRDAIGLIGVSWISDRSDSLHLTFHDKIKVMSISHKDDLTEGVSYKPYQAYMYEGVYPFTRGVYVINNEPYSGLLSRFASFLTNDKGQRILYKAGLFPAYAPIRLIQVNTEL